LKFIVRKSVKEPYDVGGLNFYGFEDTVNSQHLLEDVDVFVDFTTPQSTFDILRILPEKSRVVVGTTGFDDSDLGSMRNFCIFRGMKILYAPNITDGINVMIKGLEVIKELWSNADVEIFEEHSRDKKKVPGTAGRIAEKLCKKVDDIYVVRAGGIVGVHRVKVVTDTQEIEILHRSFSREAFADGACRCIDWILRVRKPGLYFVDEVYK